MIFLRSMNQETEKEAVDKQALNKNNKTVDVSRVKFSMENVNLTQLSWKCQISKPPKLFLIKGSITLRSEKSSTFQSRGCSYYLLRFYFSLFFILLFLLLFDSTSK